MSNTIGLICGSLRKNSYNRIIAQSLTEMVDSHQFRWIELNELPLFNEDLETSVPEAVTSFKSAIQDVDGIIPFQKMLISQVHEKIDSDQKVLTDEQTKRYLQRYLHQFINWIDKTPVLD
ncbi:hypothetical protein BED47_08100 [Gottfriedia luciferensis]|uniref:NADPH-dependent FMN reductase-like domain-containing protein n=1 Tax=Gottfriedia luciferensis TaxID=178774 RepID=A0ABX2ZMQ2_9BACI|nr:NAD(P)H-dependent oxidoreductase [Gottfriedia luciferensis]ODG90991.1 hypothetical protein BED47_08100 [Gottfriedia luciferensis]